MTGATLLATLLSLICIRAGKNETRDETISHG
jgi:hypothetical protein